MLEILSACIFVCHMYDWFLLRSDEGIRCPGTGLRGGCVPPYDCWELKLGPLQDQPVLLVTGQSL